MGQPTQYLKRTSLVAFLKRFISTLVEILGHARLGCVSCHNPSPSATFIRNDDEPGSLVRPSLFFTLLGEETTSGSPFQWTRSIQWTTNGQWFLSWRKETEFIVERCTLEHQIDRLPREPLALPTKDLVDPKRGLNHTRKCFTSSFCGDGTRHPRAGRQTLNPGP